MLWPTPQASGTLYLTGMANTPQAAVEKGRRAVAPSQCNGKWRRLEVGAFFYYFNSLGTMTQIIWIAMPNPQTDCYVYRQHVTYYNSAGLATPQVVRGFAPASHEGVVSRGDIRVPDSPRATQGVPGFSGNAATAGPFKSPR